MQLCDLSSLSVLQRVILISNGTLTKLLENLVCESLTVIKLHENLEISPVEIPYLELAKNEQIVQRKICLQGQKSGTNWLYAESIIVPARLPALFREELLKSQIPIGTLWTKHRVEMFKELQPPFCEIAGELATHFNVAQTDKLLGRTYRVFSNQMPIMMLTEKFPSRYFTNSA